MLRSNLTQRGDATPQRFVLYVEGPRDSDILRSWARLVSPALARVVERSAVILGGRQPARAVDHFQGLGAAREEGQEGRLQGLCVLDRDGGDASPDAPVSPDLAFYTWPRRHIESYLLVPDAICRSLRLSRDDPRAHAVRLHVPGASDEERLGEIDAKRLLSSKGPLARDLGRAVSAAAIARGMRRHDLHEDVVSLLGDVAACAGIREPVSVVRGW